MITVRTSGGLGNQMFQYAFGRAKTLKNNEDFSLFFASDKSSTPRTFLLENFNIKAKMVDSVGIKDRLLKITERQYTFSKDIYDISKGYFVGIWQSEKYFKDFEKDIRMDLTLKNPLSAEARAFEKSITESDSVSVHIRRGDYVSNDYFNKKHGVLGVEYYTEAMESMSKKVPAARLFIFSDDVVWVKENLPLPPSAVVVSDSGLSEYEELILMTYCKHHVIANSSFSWWGAWLDPRPDKIVIAPKLWNTIGTDTSDLIPSSWIRI